MDFKGPLPPAINPWAAGIRPTQVRLYSEAVGPQGYDLAIGDLRPPEFYTPRHIREAACRALDDGQTFYPPAQGIFPLREAVANKFSADTKSRWAPEQVLVTTGATEALFCALMTVISSGDEVLLPDPAHDIYRPMVDLARGVAVSYYCGFDAGYLPDPDQMRRLIGPRTRAILVNTPYSPTGQVMSLPIMERILALAEEYNLWILADETYDRFTFDGVRHTSFLTLPAARGRTLVAGALSKSYAMTGWRVGYLVGPESAVRVATKVHRNVVSGVNTLAQWAGVAALTGDQTVVDEFVAALAESRQVALEAIESIDGVKTVPPQGTFYLYAHIGARGVPAEDLAKRLLSAGVATVPGSNWGDAGAEQFLRLSFSHRRPYMEQAMEVFTRVVGGP